MTRGAIVRTLGNALRYFAALAVAATCCAGASYALVRYLTRDVSLYVGPDDRAIAEATDLRNHSRALAQLSGEWFRKAAEDGRSPGHATWIQRDFQPRLNDLRQRLVHVSYPSDATSGLLRAADALHASAVLSSDEARRQKTAEIVLQAILDAEYRVGLLGVNPNELPPPVPGPEFGED